MGIENHQSESLNQKKNNEKSEDLKEHEISPELVKALDTKRQDMSKLFDLLDKGNPRYGEVEIPDKANNKIYNIKPILSGGPSLPFEFEILKQGSQNKMYLGHKMEDRDPWDIVLELNNNVVSYLRTQYKPDNKTVEKYVGKNIADLLKTYDKFIGLMKLEVKRVNDDNKKKTQQF